jgi:iron complex outermembrane receptor protein
MQAGNREGEMARKESNATRVTRNAWRKATSASLAALAFGIAQPAFAQDPGAAQQPEADADDAGGVPVITVTARRVAESLQETPVAVSAFNAEALAARGIVDTSEVGNFAPNVTLDTTSTFSGASSTLQAFIRGIGQSDFAINTDPGVGIYIDDVYIARTVGSVSELYDVQQVEVLKGPQGTLFGRNSIGGAINVRTARPDDTFSVRGSLSYGRFNYIGIDAVANLPLADTLFSSIAVSTNNQDGFQRRLVFDGPGAENILPLSVRNVSDTNGLDGGGLDNQTIRGKLLWEASDRFETTFSVDYSRIRDAAPPGTLVATIGSEERQFVGVDGGGELANGSLSSLFNACLVESALPPGTLPPVCGLTGFASANSDANPNNNVPIYGSQFITGDPDTTFATGANFSNIDSWGISNVSEFDLSEAAQIKTVLAYRELSANFGRDIDGSPLDIDQTSFIIEQNQLSAELQLNGKLLDNRLRYTLGGFYFREDAFQLDQVPLGGGLLNIFGPNSQDTEAFALFGETNFEVVPNLNVLFGVRWTDETKELILDQQNTTPFFGVVFAGLVDADGDSVFPRTNPDGTPNVNFLGPQGVQRADFSDVSIRAGVNYKITPDVFTYFTFSQGFKSGGFTTRLTAPFNPDFDGVPGGLAALNGIVFQPETSDNYEIGIKADLLDRKLRTNLALFWNDYQDIQIVVQRGITPSNENAGDARIRGAELELEFYPTEAFSFVGSVGYLDARYTSIDPLAFPVEIDDRLQNTPEFTFSGAATYEKPILNGRADLLLNLNYSWRDTVANDSQNTPELIQGPVGLLGGQIKISPAQDNWSISLIGRNILNKRFIGSGFNSGPGVSFVEATFNRPGEWRVQFDFEF